MGKKSAPEPPDPRETAAASTSTNIGTAIANAGLNQVNQITPDGNLTYSQTGSSSWTDPYTGETYLIPRYTATQTLSPAQQAIKTQTDAAELNLGTLANNQSAFLNDYMSKPVDLNNEATEARLFDLGRARLDPMFEEQQKALDAKLANQGIALGSRAYDAAQRQQYQSQNDAYNSLLLSGRGQAVQEALTERNQPINEITALLSGSQVSQPNFINPPQSNIPTTDVAGLINQNYNQKLGIWGQQQAATQGVLGGLFGLGAAGIMASDRRVKKDIRQIGTADNGLAIYAYRYIDGGPTVLGFMADEVEGINPDAVIAIDGIKHVNYDMAVQ